VGNAVAAHENPFNRWVAGPGAAYFSDTDGLSTLLDQLLTTDRAILEAMQAASHKRWLEDFTQTKALGAYEDLLQRYS